MDYMCKCVCLYVFLPFFLFFLILVKFYLIAAVILIIVFLVTRSQYIYLHLLSTVIYTSRNG